MKEKIHPEYHVVSVHCSCGNTWTTKSILKELRIEICSNCHPYFTGKAKLMDTAGRIERFKKRYGPGTATTAAAVAAKETKTPAPAKA